MAHPKHQAVRVRYNFCCGYCGTSEIDTGGELTVDHFYPKVAGRDDSDDNLVYACNRCNQYKGQLRPEATDPTREQRLLHPLLDDLAAHIRLNADGGDLEGLTVTGVFHIAALRLNRSELIAQRLRQRITELKEERYTRLRSENIQLLGELTRYESQQQPAGRRHRRKRRPNNPDK